MHHILQTVDAVDASDTQSDSGVGEALKKIGMVSGTEGPTSDIYRFTGQLLETISFLVSLRTKYQYDVKCHCKWESDVHCLPQHVTSVHLRNSTPPAAASIKSLINTHSRSHARKRHGFSLGGVAVRMGGGEESGRSPIDMGDYEYAGCAGGDGETALTDGGEYDVGEYDSEGLGVGGGGEVSEAAAGWMAGGHDWTFMEVEAAPAARGSGRRHITSTTAERGSRRRRNGADVEGPDSLETAEGTHMPLDLTNERRRQNESTYHSPTTPEKHFKIIRSLQHGNVRSCLLTCSVVKNAGSVGVCVDITVVLLVHSIPDTILYIAAFISDGSSTNWLDYSPSNLANRVRFPAGSPPPSGFSHVGIVPDDAVGRRVFSGISRFLRPFIQALQYTHLASPSLALETSLLRAARVSSLTRLLCTNALRCPSSRWPVPAVTPEGGLIGCQVSRGAMLMKELTSSTSVSHKH
ncbi:hypothetical protein PR048_028106 [Dryococelus australis]|uniref:Uncharacterized protein n=1 Tax=Dryococelus australis TaxID=614101 RepID=A0ABQ9GIC7_9NEOP|nr:hypothetical protein PR048_028106 [Dryococelus australis]